MVSGRRFGLPILVAWSVAGQPACSSEGSSREHERANAGGDAAGAVGGRGGGEGSDAAPGAGGSGEPAIVCSDTSCRDGCRKLSWPPAVACEAGAIEPGSSVPSISIGCGYVVFFSPGPSGEFEQSIYDEATGVFIGQRAIRPRAIPSVVCSDSRPDVRRTARPSEPWDPECPSARICYPCSMGTSTTSYTCLGDGGSYPWSPADGGTPP